MDRLPLQLQRMTAAGRDALAAATAGAIAWLLASWLFGHTHPVFAMVTAIVCLAPGLPNHGRQATGIILGVAIGILVGEAALQLPVTGIEGPTMSLLRMIVAILLSMMVGASFGLPAVVPIQAGVSAVLVLAMGADSAGWHRMQDVIIGVGVGLFFSQVLLTPDPLRQIDRAMSELLTRIAGGLDLAAQALQDTTPRRAEIAQSHLSRVQETIGALQNGIDSARYEARWSLRGRIAANRVRREAERVEHDAIRLGASALLLGDALLVAMRNGNTPPAGLEANLRHLAASCRARMTGTAPPDQGLARTECVDSAWADVLVQMRALGAILGAEPRLDQQRREAYQFPD
ncbi:aromatic acid exporter family protein [Rhodobacter sp. 24-YEA-8]|uniref:FUSC family protein n=1 Tax=Rhodobacter sp. 24-YEA-8 TaxID=1884310 RepID=UPI00089C491C|nr:FUSC family protein [Rhodobacter sp. 24-YEA-8]SED43926.1 Fusaric acid resistance protein-like [Rhodobacter sp. 24-YEA-8]